jgi:hypothetical protein
MDKEKLKSILDNHSAWLISVPGGERADLSRANLIGADLIGSNLSGADLSGADLSGADLSGAKFDDIAKARLRIIPDGDIVGWKKLLDGKIAKLLIPANAARSNSTGRKCRASEAVVLAIYDGDEEVSEGWSTFDENFCYRVGETVKPDNWDEDWAVECGGGIHFFITREEAEAYD